jgi:hypothetical protein
MFSTELDSLTFHHRKLVGDVQCVLGKPIRFTVPPESIEQPQVDLGVESTVEIAVEAKPETLTARQRQQLNATGQVEHTILGFRRDNHGIWPERGKHPGSRRGFERCKYRRHEKPSVFDKSGSDLAVVAAFFRLNMAA